MFITDIFYRLHYGKLIGVPKQVACYRKYKGGGKSTYTFLNSVDNKVSMIMDELKVTCDNSMLIFRTRMDGECKVISKSSITRTPYHYPGIPNPVIGIKYRYEKILPSGETELKYVTCEPNRELPSGKLYYEKSKIICDPNAMDKLMEMLFGVCSAK